MPFWGLKPHFSSIIVNSRIWFLQKSLIRLSEFNEFNETYRRLWLGNSACFANVVVFSSQLRVLNSCNTKREVTLLFPFPCLIILAALTKWRSERAFVIPDWKRDCFVFCQMERYDPHNLSKLFPYFLIQKNGFPGKPSFLTRTILTLNFCCFSKILSKVSKQFEVFSPQYFAVFFF